ncbi:hypothetical protein RJ640_007457 [Escallonia rubra]|uniref:Uncharacterized protein n=1 Tax=Escallonia rubra TaxID=112253 RepID=A0AA88R1V9_9ASTE|nr:hypothetical protein RJ640_007457 [Escallonia rubra]
MKPLAHIFFEIAANSFHALVRRRRHGEVHPPPSPFGNHHCKLLQSIRNGGNKGSSAESRVGLTLQGNSRSQSVTVQKKYTESSRFEDADIVESEKVVVAADDGRCSEVGASVLRRGGHVVDDAVATALCLSIVNPMASGIGDGGFMIVQSSATHKLRLST